MISKNDRPGVAAELRKHAEKIAREKASQSPEDIGALSPAKIRRRLHELQVHQIELEMQNEELIRTQQELEASRDRFVNFYDLSPVGYLTLNKDGLIVDVNIKAANLLEAPSNALVRQPLTRFILPADQDIFYRHLNKLNKVGQTQACELRLAKKDETPFWVRLDSNLARGVDGKAVKRIVMSDITEFKRTEADMRAAYTKLEMLWGVASMADADVKTISDHILASITKMSDSKYGFYGFVNEDESVMTIHSWSGKAMKDCLMADKPQQFPVCKAGVWAEAIRRREPLILNDYTAAHPGKDGLPQGSP